MTGVISDLRAGTRVDAAGRDQERLDAAYAGEWGSSIEALLADAIFASGLQRCDEPSVSRVRQSATAAIRAFGYPGCAGRVAQEFGDHPETAVIRMRWARAVVRRAFADPPADGQC